MQVDSAPQAIVQTGRWVSAAFAAGAVAAFALLAWWNYGLLIGWGAGLVVVVQDDLFELSHYMKEDPALLFGLALALLAAHIWWRQPGRRSLRFLAIGCGLATAGKYLGIISLGFGLPLVIWVLFGYFRSIPKSIDEAARIDGAKPLAIFCLITLPMSLPGVVTTGLLSFIAAWNEFMFALAFTSDMTCSMEDKSDP